MSSAGLHEAILYAARTVIKATAGVPHDGEWEGVPYNPKADTPWLRDALVPVSSEPSANGTIAHLTLYTVNLFYPVDPTAGTRVVGAAAGALLDAFKVGTWLEYGTVRGLCLKAERKQVVLEPQWVSIPIIARILAYSTD